MTLNLRLAILVVTLMLAFVIYKTLSKSLIPVRYSFLWWCAVGVLLVLSLVPDVLIWFAAKLGFQTISNLVVGVFIVILFFITISLTIIVSSQNKKINLLIQEVSLLKNELKNKE